MKWILMTAVLSAFASVAAGDEDAAEPTRHAHQITGLFSPDRADDLRLIVAELPGIELIAVDFENAEATFGYDPATAFPNAPPGEIVRRLDNQLRQASRGTFGVKPICTTPREGLRLVEIPVAGLDCKGCSLSAYEAIYRLDGVERATASFRDRLVTAWIHPDKTDRPALEDALRKRGVDLTPAPDR